MRKRSSGEFMIAIVDYGFGNLKSIYNMLKKIGVSSIITCDPNIIANADKLILPGVGSFDEGMKSIRERNLEEPLIKAALIDRKPILGICLGMQLLGNNSEEGSEKGLGLVDMSIKKFVFPKSSPLKIPHMGWNSVIVRQDSVFSVINNMNPRFYFVHSYYAQCHRDEDVLMECQYGFPFSAAIAHNNIYGFQFHPEKSHLYGLELLKIFSKIESNYATTT